VHYWQRDQLCGQYLRLSGMQTDLRPSEGDLAFLESELRVTGLDEFQEDGKITYDENEHVLRFSTVGRGHVSPGLEPGTKAASWRVDGRGRSICLGTRLYHFGFYD